MHFRIHAFKYSLDRVKARHQIKEKKNIKRALSNSIASTTKERDHCIVYVIDLTQLKGCEH